MTTPSLQGTSPATPTTRDLIDLAHQHGIRVWWSRHQGGRAQWSATHRSVWLAPDLTDREARSLLAHELGHAHYGDQGPQGQHHEARAWRHAAWLLVDKDAYVTAEILHGQDTAAIADELHVTVEVIHAHQATLRRSA